MSCNGGSAQPVVWFWVLVETKLLKQNRLCAAWRLVSFMKGHAPGSSIAYSAIAWQKPWDPFLVSLSFVLGQNVVQRDDAGVGADHEAGEVISSGEPLAVRPLSHPWGADFPFPSVAASCCSVTLSWINGCQQWAAGTWAAARSLAGFPLTLYLE